MSSALCSILDTSCTLRPVVCLSVSHSLFLSVSISFWLSLNLSLSFAGLHAGKCKTFNIYNHWVVVVEERWNQSQQAQAVSVVAWVRCPWQAVGPGRGQGCSVIWEHVSSLLLPVDCIARTSTFSIGGKKSTKWKMYVPSWTLFFVSFCIMPA